MPYATTEQLGAYFGADGESESPSTIPEDAARLLVRASELVADHIVTAVYDVDSDGNATDGTVIAALRDATCAQVEFWLTGDEEDDILGPLQSVSTQGVQLQMGAGENRPTPMYLAPRAARALRRAGLLSGVVGS
ncbi:MULTISPECIES: hypothetical protein [unclassified Nocardioides]|uniref:hypothetical protein n=1 Tax=unclassified Nocardioides TaxID=2615069 RepID=UPI0009F0AB59|nr:MULTISPECIES: hypothetical protein [unclassified Nocardioides]GAW50610.1 uncharacterized protein PD653B2_2946 [Nocardioides sp. PD653-B2]GAW55509.1 uncharacterized protein PD653_2934 [Nocardioides sp. PD653]